MMSEHTESHEEMMKRHREERSRHREKAEKRAAGGAATLARGGEAAHKRHEHEKLARGGPAKDEGGIGEDGSMKGMESYTAGDPDVEKEAERRARGGPVMKKGKMPTMVHGSAPRHHSNRPGRKSGGSVGADSHPMTEASKLKMPEGLSRDGGVDREDD
jgi:hypothetical protein